MAARRVGTPSRPFLRLGTSKGFTYTYDPSRAEGDRVLGMSLNGTADRCTTSYSVTVNSFLASGGDNFRVFAQGTQKRDTGKVDLQAMVDYMDEFANASEGDAPLAPDFTQHSVGVDFPADAPASYEQGDDVTFNLSSLAFSTAPDVKDTEVAVRFGGDLLGTFPVDNTIGTAVFDEYGTATVTVTIPNGTPDGTVTLKVMGNNTGTRVDVPITVRDDRDASTISVPDVSVEYGRAGELEHLCLSGGHRFGRGLQGYDEPRHRDAGRQRGDLRPAPPSRCRSASTPSGWPTPVTATSGRPPRRWTSR